MRSDYYSIPFRPIDILQGKSTEKSFHKSSLVNNIDQHIRLLFVTAFGDLRYDHNYGSIVNDLDFSNERQSGLFERLIESSLTESIAQYEPRLSHISITVRFDRKGEMISTKTDSYRMYIHVNLTGKIIMTNESFKSNFTVFFAPISE